MSLQARIDTGTPTGDDPYVEIDTTEQLFASALFPIFDSDKCGRQRAPKALAVE
ncbi:MAG: hypothetical protein ABIQ51_07730 [Mesorhizobium sp.]